MTTPDFRALLADDAYAASFQSMGQYRTALLKALATPAVDDLEADFRAWYQDVYGSAYFRPSPLCVAVEWAQNLLLRHVALTPAPEPPTVIGPEWQPCVKLPITVHVREQRPGETHSSTREGITPLRSDDLIMRGVQGEEYPIGRELFNQTYRMGEALATPPPAPPTDDEIEEAAKLIHASMRFAVFGEHCTSDWVERGNSLMQDEARRTARAVLERWGHR